MSSAKPALGYPSRTAAIIALREQGFAPAVIASKIGIDVKTVSALAGTGALPKRGAYSSPAPIGGRGIEINAEYRRLLRRHAAARELSVDALIVLLIERIAEANLVNTVLQDQGVLYK